MWNSLSQLLQGQWRGFALSLLVLAAPLQGCIVNNGSSRGSIIVQWDTQAGTSCASLGISSVNVVAWRDGAAYGTFTNGICQAGSLSIQVGEGNYTIHVDGIAPNGAVVATSPSASVAVLAYTTVTSPILVMSPLGTTTGNTSSIQASWSVAGQAPATACGTNGVKTVVLSIVDSSQTKVLATAQAPCATGYATVTGLAAGTYYVQLDGYTASDASGQPSWGTLALKGPLALAANTDMTFNGPLDIVKLGSTSTTGGLTLGWTTFGSPAASGCSKYVIDKLNVTVLGADKTTALQTLPVACSAGQLAFANLPAGSVYVRIDEANPPDTSAYGNINLAGPFTVLGNQTANVSAPIDIGQRTIIGLPVAFNDGATCQSHGVGSVQYQVSGNGKLIVPFNDADATKPCDLSTASYKQYVIDLDNSPPACAVPPNAVGLVICNAHGISTLSIQAHGLVGNSIAYAAKMDVQNLSDGKLTNVQTPLKLQPCGAGDPLCQ